MSIYTPNHLNGLILTAVLAIFWTTPAVADDGNDFEGYWIGIDPLDGGDTRRSFVATEDGESFSGFGRDSFVTLCGGSPNALFTIRDVTVDDDFAETDNVLIECVDTLAELILRGEYTLKGNLLIEKSFTLGGELVTEIIFHRITED